MLETLLNEIRAGGTLQPAALAARMRVSPAMVVMMLEDLERMGKLTRVNTDCDEKPCGTCAVAELCAPQGAGKGRVWMVKEKSPG